MWASQKQIYYAAVMDREPPAARVAEAADRLAARLDDEGRSFAEAARGGAPEYRALLQAVADLDPRFAFDHTGRPGAIQAVRGALPAIERDLFDAIVEDHACEVAAVEEALYQLTLAYGRRRARTS